MISKDYEVIDVYTNFDWSKIKWNHGLSGEYIPSSDPPIKMEIVYRHKTTGELWVAFLDVSNKVWKQVSCSNCLDKTSPTIQGCACYQCPACGGYSCCRTSMKEAKCLNIR